MLSKKLVVALVLTSLIVSTLVTDGEAAGFRKDDAVDQRNAAAGQAKDKSDVRPNPGFGDGYTGYP